jgi:glycine dehydrogenase
MLAVLGHKTMEEFIDATIPSDLRVAELTDKEGEGIRPFSELELRRRAEEVAAMNKSVKSYIGMG